MDGVAAIVSRVKLRDSVRRDVAGGVGLMHQHGLRSIARQRKTRAGPGDEGAAIDGVLIRCAGLQTRNIDRADPGDAVARSAAVGRKRDGRCGSRGIEREIETSVRRDVAGGVGLMHQHGLRSIAGQREARTGPRDEGAAIDGVLPRRTGLQAGNIDRADPGDAVARKAAVGRKRDGRCGSRGIEREIETSVRRDVAGGVGLMHQHGLRSIAGQREACAGPRDEGAAIDGVLPRRAGLQAGDIDGANFGDPVACKAAVGRKRDGRCGSRGIERVTEPTVPLINRGSGTGKPAYRSAPQGLIIVA